MRNAQEAVPVTSSVYLCLRCDHVGKKNMSRGNVLKLFGVKSTKTYRDDLHLADITPGRISLDVCVQALCL